MTVFFNLSTWPNRSWEAKEPWKPNLKKVHEKIQYTKKKCSFYKQVRWPFYFDTKGKLNNIKMVSRFKVQGVNNTSRHKSWKRDSNIHQGNSDLCFYGNIRENPTFLWVWSSHLLYESNMTRFLEPVHEISERRPGGTTNQCTVLEIRIIRTTCHPGWWNHF